jgi:hypothetical protein
MTPETKHAPNITDIKVHLFNTREDIFYYTEIQHYFTNGRICKMFLWSYTMNYQIIRNSLQQSAAYGSHISIYIHSIYITRDA